MTITTLIIEDEVNCKFTNLSIECRRDLVKALEYFVPGAKFTPQYKLGRWNGKQSFCTIGGSSYINLIDKLLPVVQRHGYTVEVEDNRKKYDFKFDKVDKDSYSHITWPKGHPIAGQPIVIKDHQIEAINMYLDNIAGIMSLPTSAGKTILTSILSHKVEKYGRSIVIVPTKDLVTQTEDDYKNFGLDVGVFFGDRKEYNKTHTICTWQSIEALSKKTKDNDVAMDIYEFFKDVVCVIGDEAHKVGAPVLQKLLSVYLANVPIRWGMTGTIPYEESERQAIISVLGPVINEITAKSLQDKGILATVNINVWQMQDIGAIHGSYATELKWLTTNKSRISYLAKEFERISESGNTLILVDRIETGDLLADIIPNSIFLSGRDKSKDRKAEYKEIQQVNNRTIIATFGIASTGININRIFNLILFEPGKSFTRVIQSIGRSVRMAADKDHAEIYDICSDAKYSKRHLTERKKYYKNCQYPFKVSKISY